VTADQEAAEKEAAGKEAASEGFGGSSGKSAARTTGVVYCFCRTALMRPTLR
jgi:hypothetical protein